MDKTLRGKAWVFGNDIDTDVIIPARYLVTSNQAELGKHCMEDLDPTFAGRISPGDFIVAGENFGCGSSREHAPLALKGALCSGVIAASFARIFYRNAINVALPIFECPEAISEISPGEFLEVNPSSGSIRVVGSGKSFRFASFPPFLGDLIALGGLVPFVRNELKEREER
jgi:3-isopropylmalate/(R)-2-methylmalate dehydratase small subunit